ncbi:MAG: peptidoglycan-binding protein [Actinomycetota bacterium]|nr:peptidoglycan-binding protein [Actinomycetota bacterium]
MSTGVWISVIPILPGVRGPAVEDIQRRLLGLGYELGPTGVDGVFLGMTRDAVVAFQTERGLVEDGVVGDETWNALVDATFTLGDRMLYLRLPYFHGRDVAGLQEALNTLGFSSGQPDGIFGAYTERAVREFQLNCGQPADGIVGPETVRTVVGLRHVWEGKDVSTPREAKVAAARACDVLRRFPLSFAGDSAATLDIAERVVNLARATTEEARVSLSEAGIAAGAFAFLRIVGDCVHDGGGVPVVQAGSDEGAALAARILIALGSRPEGSVELCVAVDQASDMNERDRQRTAVRILDALCVALA